MTSTARLIEVAVPDAPEGAVLVLHGGASRGTQRRVSPAQPSVLRMIPIAGRIARAGAGRLAVFRLLDSYRGWDRDRSPLEDAHWALEQVAQRLHGRIPTCLVGHSLGGRTALLNATAPGVRSAVALAPWVYPTDVPDRLAGQRILIVHGSRDRVASPQRSRELAGRLAVGADVSYVEVRGATHSMLARGGVFDGLAAQFVAVTLLNEPPDEPRTGRWPGSRRASAG